MDNANKISNKAKCISPSEFARIVDRCNKSSIIELRAIVEHYKSKPYWTTPTYERMLMIRAEHEIEKRSK